MYAFLRHGSLWALIVLTAVPSLGCVHVPRQARASVRKAEYFTTHPELPPSIAEAIDRGHVIIGMDREQVTVVLGTPAKRTSFGGRPPVDVWIYPAARFHQDQLHAHGATLFRLVFRDGQLSIIEPI